MTKKEREQIVKWADGLTDEQLESEYYDSVFDSLGSQTEKMYELGYDISDIFEREKYEKFLCEKSDLLDYLCAQRNIVLWQS